MLNQDKRKELFGDQEKFPPIIDLAYGNVWWGADDPRNEWHNASFSRAHPERSANTAKLIRLAFHDCVKSMDSEGNRLVINNMYITLHIYPNTKSENIMKKLHCKDQP